MKYLKAFDLITVNQLSGYTDRTPIGESGGFDFHRKDYQPHCHLPTNFSVVMWVYPKDAKSFGQRFLLN
jgi:hypothetical protein